MKLISDVFNLNTEVTPIEVETICDRTLSSSREGINFKVPELEVQLKELVNYSLE